MPNYDLFVTGVALHEGNMLMSCRAEYYLRLIEFEDLFDSRKVGDGTDKDTDIDSVILCRFYDIVKKFVSSILVYHAALRRPPIQRCKLLAKLNIP